MNARTFPALLWAHLWPFDSIHLI